MGATEHLATWHNLGTVSSRSLPQRQAFQQARRGFSHCFAAEASARFSGWRFLDPACSVMIVAEFRSHLGSIGQKVFADKHLAAIAGELHSLGSAPWR
jgi:hypothetical protein